MPTLSVQCINSHHHSCAEGKEQPSCWQYVLQILIKWRMRVIRHSLAMSLEQGTIPQKTPSLLNSSAASNSHAKTPLNVLHIPKCARQQDSTRRHSRVSAQSCPGPHSLLQPQTVPVLCVGAMGCGCWADTGMLRARRSSSSLFWKRPTGSNITYLQYSI